MQFSFQTVQFSPRFGCQVLLSEVLAAASAAGFKSVGLDIWSVSEYVEPGRTLDPLASMLEPLELGCTDVLALAVGSDGNVTLESAARLATMAATTGASACATTFGPEISDPRDRRARESLRRCADVFAGADVRMAIEYFPYSCVRSLSDAVELCDGVGWDAAGVLVDSWHTLVTGQVADISGLSADQIALVQYSDGVIPQPDDVVDGSRNDRRLPGRGELDLRAFVAAVIGTGYNGIVSTEVLSTAVRANAPAPFAVSAHRILREHWTSLGDANV